MKIQFGILALCIVLPCYLFAHAPKKVNISYNQDSKKLSLVIEHNVANVTNHYISSIKIKVDGKEVKEVNPTSQTSKATEVIDIDVPEIKVGSKVEVKATCVIFGSKTGKLIVK